MASNGKQPRIAVVGLFHETNTFAPGVTGHEGFEPEWVEGNEAFLRRYDNTRTSMSGVIHRSREEGAEIVVGLYAAVAPSSMVTKEAAERAIEAVVASIDPTVDGIIAIMHGAMVAEHLPDVEGETLERIRKKVGRDMPLAITLDLHANITQRMVDYADIIVGFDTYPHIDAYDRAREAFGLLLRMVKGEIRPVRAMSQPRMLVVPQMMVTGEPGPMKELMERAFAIEEDPKVLNVTVLGGFPYSDVPGAGMAFVVTTDGDEALARKYADELSAMAWERRERFRYTALPAEEAVKAAFAEPEGPVILVEGSDNVGGGAPADATHVLKHLVDAPKKALIVIRDVEAAALAHKLGVGADFDAEVGGRSDELHGRPVRIKGKVRVLFDGKFNHAGPFMTGRWADMGKTAVVEAGNLTVVLTTRRTAPYDVCHVTSVGLLPEQFHAIVVKSAIAWKTAFGNVCKKVIPVDTPGCCSSNLDHFEYKHLTRPLYPFDPVVQ